jgi:DNA-binding GntR family transcriptional regulator
MPTRGRKAEPMAKKIRESDRIESELKRLILTLELEPGMAITEASLMERYGWGRTPQREAFQRLAQQGLLQLIPRHGAVVTALSLFDFVEMMDAMSMVIGQAAALACKHLREEDLAALDSLIEESEEAAARGDFVAVADLDYQFHKILANATGNRYLSAYLLHLHQVARRFNFAAWRRDADASASIREHREIVETLRSRDADAAKRVMRAHVEGGRQRVVGAMGGLS